MPPPRSKETLDICFAEFEDLRWRIQHSLTDECPLTSSMDSVSNMGNRVGEKHFEKPQQRY